MAQEAALYYTNAEGMKGDNIITSRADSSTVFELHHDVQTSVEAHSGLATGRRVHGPVKLLKPIDRATPLLYKALCLNQTLLELEIKWFRPNPESGVTEHFYSTVLRNVRVNKLEAWLPNTQDAEEKVLSPREWVYFLYAQIEWTWVDGGIMHVDDIRDTAAG